MFKVLNIVSALLMGIGAAGFFGMFLRSFLAGEPDFTLFNASGISILLALMMQQLKTDD